MATQPPPPPAATPSPPPPVPAAVQSTAPSPQPPQQTQPPPITPPPPPSSTSSTASVAVKQETPPPATTTAGTEDSYYTVTIPSYSAWFSYDAIHDTERRLLPEFFSADSEASGCRGPSAYKYYRDAIVRRFRARPARRLTLTETRRGLVGDAGSVRRVFDFLEEWGLINYGISQTGTKPAKEKKEEVPVPVPVQAPTPVGAAAPRKLCTGCRSVCGLAYFACEKADISLCARCYVRGNYRPGLTSGDFKRIEITEEAKSEWTDKETLHLLEAILHYGEDWRKVSEHVGSRSEKDCIARFVRLPFGEQFMGPREDTKHFENDDDDDDESREIVKRQRLTPLADASNPIMAQVAFLSAIVGSDAAAAAAQAAISAQSQVDVNASGADSFINNTKEEETSSTNGLSTNDLLKEAAANAQLQLQKEREDIEKSLSDIVDVQMREIQDKIGRFEQMELLMEREWQQLRRLRDSLFADQLAIPQHQHKPALVTTESRDNSEKSNPVIDTR